MRLAGTQTTNQNNKMNTTNEKSESHEKSVALVESSNVESEQIANAKEVKPTKGKKSVKTVALLSKEQAQEYIASMLASGKPFEGVNALDVFTFTKNRIDAASGGMRDAVLAIGAANLTGETFANALEEKIRATYPKSSSDCLMSASRKIYPKLVELKALSYRDPFNLRTVSRPLNDASHPAHKTVCAGIKANKSVGAIVKDIEAMKEDTTGATNGANKRNTDAGGNENDGKESSSSDFIGLSKSQQEKVMSDMMAEYGRQHKESNLVIFLAKIAKIYGFALTEKK